MGVGLEWLDPSVRSACSSQPEGMTRTLPAVDVEKGEKCFEMSFHNPAFRFSRL
jgi:hypothetical protein